MVMVHEVIPYRNSLPVKGMNESRDKQRTVRRRERKGELSGNYSATRGY